MVQVRKTVIPVVSMVVILCSVGGLLAYLRTSPRFELTRVGVGGNVRLTPESIVACLELPPQVNIFRIHLEALQTRLAALPWIKTVNVFRNLPDKISIELTERTPYALVKLDKLYLVDNEGVILEALASGSEITLPIITGRFVEQLDLQGENGKLRQVLQSLGELMQAAPPMFQNIRKVQIHSLENVTLFGAAPAAPEIRVSLVNYHQNVERLQRLYPTLPLAELAYIDLRFDRRIIVKANKS